MQGLKGFLLFGILICCWDCRSEIFRTREYTCAELQTISNVDGELKVKTISGGDVRYVSRIETCAKDEEALPAYEPASDRYFCFVGYECSFRRGG